MKKSVYLQENMTYFQRDRLDRIQHTLLLNTEKIFIENEQKMLKLDVFFGSTILMLQPSTM
jgi:hypothetical protein